MNRRGFVRTFGGGAFAHLGLFGGRTMYGQSALSADVGHGTATGVEIRLANNENPYGPGPRALEAVRDMLATANRYPRALPDTLVSTLAEHHGVAGDHILLSGGSGDIMRAAVYAFTSATRSLVTPRPTYEAPMRSAQHIGSPVVRVPLTAASRLDLAAVATKAVGAGLVYLCNPNNPTATTVPAAELAVFVERMARTSPETRLFIDEAYLDYADRKGVETMIPITANYPQVIVTRTFSKIHGMAGMRVGYAIAQPRTLERLRIRHSGSSLSAMSLAAAIASIDDLEYRERVVAMNRAVRTSMVASFSAAGYQVAPADANFIFVNLRRDIRAFHERCRLEGVHIGRAFPPMVNWARISVGTPEEMRVALPILMSALSAPSPKR